MESDKIEQMNKIGEMSSIRKICNVNHCGTVREMGGSIVSLELEIKKFKQQAERDHNVICELNNDNIILKQQNAELFKILASVKKIIDIYELYNDLSVELFYDDLEKLLKEYKG